LLLCTIVLWDWPPCARSMARRKGRPRLKKHQGAKRQTKMPRLTSTPVQAPVAGIADPILTGAIAGLAVAGHVYCRAEAAAGAWICSAGPKAPFGLMCLATGALAVVAVIVALNAVARVGVRLSR
jgi:hypothetical protein